MFNFKNIIAVALLAVAPMGFSGSADAATCSASIALLTHDGSNSNDGCETGSTNNDKINSLQVNVDTMFGFGDWLYAGKDSENGVVDIDFAVSGGLQSGTWSVISTLFSTYTDLMIVTKGANGNNTQVNYVGYLFNTATDGDYSTPFFNANNNNPKNISHWTAYVRGVIGNECPPGTTGTPPNCAGTSPVPVPAGLPLMLTVLGVGAYMRKRARKSA